MKSTPSGSTFRPPEPGHRQRVAGVDPPDPARLALHTVTTKPWDLETAIEKYAAAGVGGISVWRETIADRDRADRTAAGRRIRDAGLTPVSLVRGGFFASADVEERERALEDNRIALTEAVDLRLPAIVLVCGADPNQPLETSREQIAEALVELAPEARDAGVSLLVEPLHPMYSDTRSAVPSLAAANEICRTVDDDAVGVALDVYHLWWEPGLEEQIRLCGTGGRLRAFHVCDWKIPTTDPLLDRGVMGEGCIDIPAVRRAVERAGFTGFIEVEIFSDVYWRGDQEAYLDRIIGAYRDYV